MVEILENNYQLKHNQTALKVNRYKKQGHIIIGVGYPFYYNEFLAIVKLCDFFADDTFFSNIRGWDKRFIIKDYKSIEPEKKYIILLFSTNRISILDKIKQNVSNTEIINLCEDAEIIKSLSDIKKSKMLLYKATKDRTVDIINSIAVTGNSEIIDTANSIFRISALGMQTRALLINNSRHENIFDSLYLNKGASFQLGMDAQADIRNCLLNNNSKITIYSGKMKIEDTYIGENCIIHAYKQISIGSGTIISWNVSILDGDGHSLYSCEKNNSPQSIVIENDVWIGSNSIILKGITIGKGSVIAAGSVVTKSIPPYSLAAGNPAKVIKNNVKWEYKYSLNDFK